MKTPEIRTGHIFCTDFSHPYDAAIWQSATEEPIFCWSARNRPADLSTSQCKTVSQLRFAFTQWIESIDLELVVFHDGAGVELLRPMLKEKFPHLHLVFNCALGIPYTERHIGFHLRQTGKLLLSNELWTDELKKQLNWIPSKYLKVMSCPYIQPRESGEPKNPVVGVWAPSARNKNAIRRLIDRYHSKAYVLEVLSPIQKCPKWAQKEGVSWKGGIPLDAALKLSSRWQSVIVLNDFGLHSPFLKSLIAAQVLPITPKGDFGAGYWEEAGAPSRYEWGDFEQALQFADQWSNASPEQKELLSEWLSTHFLSESFVESYSAWKIHTMQSHIPKLGKPEKHLGIKPLWFWQRIHKMRSGTQ